MTAQRSGKSATTHAPIPVRGSQRVVKLTRMTAVVGAEVRTLCFTFEGGQPRGARSNRSFIDKEHVPAFEGSEAWFEVEQYRGTPWKYWAAVRQVERPST